MAWCCDNARLVAVATMIGALAALVYVVGHFAMNSDTQGLLSSHLEYRQQAHAFDALFQPEGEQIVIVIDGQTPELAEMAASGVAARLAARPDLFRFVDRPDAGFFTREGLLFEPLADVKTQMAQLIAAQPFLGPLAADPSLRGLFGTLSTAVQGVNAGQANLAQLNRPIGALAQSLDQLRVGKPAFFSWTEMISGQHPSTAQLRRLVLVSPARNYTSLESGAKATGFIRRTVQALNLDPAHGVSVRLTGPIPLQDQRFGSLVHGVAVIALLALVSILVMLWLAVRAGRLIVAILVTMLIGLVIAMAVGLIIYQRFNVISVAFIPLFIGLGIDFGIQFTVRSRAEHRPGVSAYAALVRAAGGMGRPLLLAAVAIAVGFLAFAPTNYLGVSQLGVIAGIGMLIAVALNLSFLPALIYLLGPPPSEAAGPSPFIEKLDGFVLTHRRLVIGVALVGALGSALLLPMLKFDFNPFHLEDKHTEAVSTLLDLMRNPDQSPNSLEIIAPSVAAANRLATRLEKLPEVAHARTVSSFVPPDQGPKLAAIADASNLLSFSLDPLVVAPAPSDQEVVDSLRSAAAGLKEVAAKNPGSPGAQAARLAADLDWLAGASPADRGRAEQMLIPPLKVVLDQARAVLGAQPVTLQTLPPEITRDWLAKDGRARVSAAPRGDSNDNAVLERFIKAVRTIAPDVTGETVGIREGGRTIAGAFLEAGVLSFVAITLLLFAVLRRVRHVAITMAPIVLTGLLTLGTCVVIHQQLNYANIIALPLLFGIGVAFHIYFVMAWRSGGSHLLQSSLTRAIFFSAMATATGFGSLWASHHPGTASMGKLLMISLLWTLVSALIFQPALMGPPPAAARKA